MKSIDLRLANYILGYAYLLADPNPKTYSYPNTSFRLKYN